MTTQQPPRTPAQKERRKRRQQEARKAKKEEQESELQRREKVRLKSKQRREKKRLATMGDQQRPPRTPHSTQNHHMSTPSGRPPRTPHSTPFSAKLQYWDEEPPPPVETPLMAMPPKLPAVDKVDSMMKKITFQHLRLDNDQLSQLSKTPRQCQLVFQDCTFHAGGKFLVGHNKESSLRLYFINRFFDIGTLAIGVAGRDGGVSSL